MYNIGFFYYGAEVIDFDRISSMVPRQFGRGATPSYLSLVVGECNMPMSSKPQMDANARASLG